MVKGRKSSIIVLLTILSIFVIAPDLGRKISPDEKTELNLGEPNNANTPIPDVYTNLFNGIGGKTTGYASFYNTTYGNLIVNNTYDFPGFHNKTIIIPQIDGFNVDAVNITIYDNKTTAVKEKYSTAWRSDISTYTTGRTVDDSVNDGLAQGFTLPVAANITQVKMPVIGTDASGMVWFQIRNGSYSLGFPELRYNQSLPSTGGLRIWQTFDLTNTDPSNVTFPGEYFVVINATNAVFGDSYSWFLENLVTGFQRYQHQHFTGDAYTQFLNTNPHVIGVEYLPINLTDPALNRTFLVNEVKLDAMVNYTAGGLGTSPRRFYDNQSLIINAPWDKSIQNLTLTSNMSCSLQYNLTVFYNRTSAFDFQAEFAIDRTSDEVTWNVNSTTSVNFTTGTFYNGTLNLTVPAAWTFVNAYNWSDGASDYAVYNDREYNSGLLHIYNLLLNGTWAFTFTSQNRLKDIWASADGIPLTNIIDVGMTVNISGQFDAAVTDGNLTVAIFEPQYRVPRTSIYGGWNDSLTTGGAFKNVTELKLGFGWSTTPLRDYGNYTVQLRWNNSGEVGFAEKNYSLYLTPTLNFAAGTENNTILITPANNIYNVSLNFTDPNDGYLGIIDLNGTTNFQTSIYYGINGPVNWGTKAFYNGTHGYYNVTLEMGTNINAWGTNYVNITAARDDAHNVSIIFNATYYNSTLGSVQGLSSQTVVNGVNATFNALYQFSDGLTSIEGAQFTYDISNQSFKPFATYNAPYYVVSFNTSLIAGMATSYHLEFNLSKTFNVTQTYAVEVYVLNKTSVRVMAASQMGGGSHFLYNKYNDTYAAGDIVEAYYGASITFGAQYWDLNGSVGIDPTGAPVGTVPASYFNVTVNTIAGPFTAALTYMGSGGNYSREIAMFSLLPGDYTGWFQFCNPTAWNATNRNFTLRILPTPTTVNPSVDVQVRQDNYDNDVPLTGTFPTFQANYGADLQIRWRMYNALNGTEMVGTTLNATFGTTTVLNSTGNAYPQVPMLFLNQATGSHNIQLTLNATGYENHTQGITIQVSPCPVIATIEMWQYTYKNGSANYGPFVGQNISIGIQFINAKNGSFLTTIGQLVINFTGEVNLTAGTWLNGNWFNASLNASAKGIGSYIIWINMTTTNYLFQNVTFTVDIQITKSEITVGSVIQGATSLVLNVDIWETQDSSGTITLTVVASNVLDHAPLSGGTVTLYYESTGAVLGTGTSIGNGQYTITIDPTNLVKNSMFLVRVNFTLTNYQESTLTIKLQIYKSGGIPIEWIMAAVILAAIGGMFALIYVGPVKKGKKRRQDELLTTASAFEDAINLQHILVIYKNTGTCIYFKSFARESIDPDLISGFLSAVSTFGTEMKVEQALDEMKYGDSVLLLNDGEQVRVALVLSKSPSSVLRANLGRFTVTFEDTFRDKLVNWRGQLGIFEGADDLVDNLLNASIILPHEVGDIKSMKLVKSILGRGVLKIAQQMTSGERKFFFLASLVSDSSEGLKRPPAEILLAIDQMRKAGVIHPIKMEQFKEKTVSPQELQLIRQQVQQLKVPQDQAETMVQALAKMESIEREAALASIKQGKQITTDLTAQLGEIKKVTSPDEAAVEIKSLEKKARGLLKEKDFEKAMNSYRGAEVLAFQWNLKEDASRFREIQLSLEVDALKTTFAETMKLAKKAESKDPKEGLETYKKARDIAQMLFKRGIATAEKDVVTLTTTIKKMEAATSGTEITSTIQGTKKDLMVERKELLGQVKALEGQEMWAKLQKVYLRLEQISNELYKMGDMTEAKNVKLYRKQAMKYQDIVSAIQQDQDGGKKPEQ